MLPLFCLPAGPFTCRRRAETQKKLEAIIDGESDDEGGGGADDEPIGRTTSQQAFEAAMELERKKKLDDAIVAFKRSIRVATERVAEAKQAGDEEDRKQQLLFLARSNGNLGIVYEKNNDSVRSVKYSGRAIAIFKELGDTNREVRMLKHMLYSCIAIGLMERARDYALRKQEIEKVTGAKKAERDLTRSQVKTIETVLSGRGRLDIKRDGNTRKVSMKRMANTIGVALKVNKARLKFLGLLAKNKKPDDVTIALDEV